ncbi:hypothetical protein BGZ65_005493, partial [Modicella reniformis]
KYIRTTDYKQMARFQSPPANRPSPRSYLASSSYDTRNLPNPFQDTPADISLKHVSATSATSNTVASSSFLSRVPWTGETLQSHSRLDKSDNTDNHNFSQSSRLYGYEESSSGKRRQALSNSDHPSHEHSHSHGHEHEQEEESDQENPLVHLTQAQREAAVENLDIETMDRVQTLRASVGVLTNSLRFRSEAELNRLPAAIRAMSVEEFWFRYNGSAKEYLERQATKKTVASTSFLHTLEQTSKQSARFKPYPDAGHGQQRQTPKPFVNLRLGQRIQRE